MKQGNQELEKAKIFFNDIGVQCCDIVPPIDSDIYCVKDQNSQWAAFRIGDTQPIVPFGKYLYMWGYDKGYCLVSVDDKDTTTFANRGIVDSLGTEVIEPYTFGDIFNFYCKDTSFVIIITHEGSTMNISFDSLRLLQYEIY